MFKTENLLEELFASPKSIVLVTEENYIIRYASLTVETIFGIKPFSLLGKNAFDFVPGNQRQQWEDCLQQSNHNGQSEITLRAADGSERHFDVSVTNHTSNQQIRGLVVLMHDITQRKADLQKLESANHHLDHFIFKTTHDLRAPLHSALGLLNLAEKADEAEKQRFMVLAKESLQQLDAVIEEVNSFYKNEKLAIQRERIYLKGLIERELARISNLPDAAKIRIDLSVDEEAPLYSDPIRITTIVANILSNAIKYSDRSKSYSYILVAARVFADQLFISIEDNGMGIEEKYQQKVFDMFFRANDQKKGTGLGLYIVKDTVERLGGKIILQSKPGVGTTFTVTLPNWVEEVVLQ